MPKQATASDHIIYDIFVPQKVPLSKISDDVIACRFWFGPPPFKNPGYAYAREEGAFWAVPLPHITPCASQEDQQTFAQNRSPQTLFLLKQKTDRVNVIK